MSTAPALAPSQLIMRVSHVSPPPPPTTLLDMATPTQLLREVLAALAAFMFMPSFMARCLCLCRSLPGRWLGGMGENVKVEEEVDAEEPAVCGLLEDVEDVEDVEEIEEIEEAEDVVEEMEVEVEAVDAVEAVEDVDGVLVVLVVLVVGEPPSAKTFIVNGKAGETAFVGRAASALHSSAWPPDGTSTLPPCWCARPCSARPWCVRHGRGVDVVGVRAIAL